MGDERVGEVLGNRALGHQRLGLETLERALIADVRLVDLGVLRVEHEVDEGVGQHWMFGAAHDAHRVVVDHSLGDGWHPVPEHRRVGAFGEIALCGENVATPQLVDGGGSLGDALIAKHVETRVAGLEHLAEFGDRGIDVGL